MGHASFTPQEACTGAFSDDGKLGSGSNPIAHEGGISINAKGHTIALDDFRPTLGLTGPLVHGDAGNRSNRSGCFGIVSAGYVMGIR
ncbi:protein of unknown function [Shinella sp. WSC3-e]|nr:protein of unknown function [Shinella sp. WSC3-e]